MAPPTDLRKGNGCLFEHPKIQSHGCRLVGQIVEQADHPKLPGNNRTGLQTHEYSNPFMDVTWSWTTGKITAGARDFMFEN